MKYQFETEEIKSCNDCPIMNSDCDHGTTCNLNIKISDCDIELPIPDDCPLIKVGE